MKYEKLTIEERKKIARYCIKENYSMEKVSEIFDIPLKDVSEYISFLSSNEAEKTAVLPRSEKKDPPSQVNKFTGYFSEMTENQIGERNEPIYTVKEILDENVISRTSNRKSFPERLRDYISDEELVIVKKINSKNEF